MIRRILLFSGDFLPKHGGVSYMMHHLANALVDAGAATLVAPPPQPGRVEGRVAYEVADGPRGAWSGRSYSPFFQARIARMVADLVRGFDAEAILVGDQGYAAPYSDGILEAARAARVPIGAYFHGADLLHHITVRLPRQGAGRLASLLGVRDERGRAERLIRGARPIFANSSFTARLAMDAGADRVVVTGCGLDPADFEREVGTSPSFDPEAKRAWRARLGLPERRTVGYVGRLAESKNVQLLLRATSELDDLQALVVGDGPQRPALEALADELGIGARVHWLGSQDESRKWDLLRAMDAFCLPSRTTAAGATEGFGIVLLEAAAAGTPAIGARTGGIPDVIEDQVTGLLHEPDDAGALAERIRTLRGDPALAAACVEGLRSRIRERFNWPRVARTVLAALEEARGAAAPPREALL